MSVGSWTNCPKCGKLDGWDCHDTGCPLLVSPMPKVTPLFTDRLTAAPPPVQPDVIAVLEKMLREARDGQLTAFAAVSFDPQGKFKVCTAGKGTFTGYLGGLETLKFDILMSQQQRKG